MVEERLLRKYLGSVHVGDFLEVTSEEESRLGFSPILRRTARGYVVMIDSKDVYLSRNDPLVTGERKFEVMVAHDKVMEYKVVRRVIDLEGRSELQ